MSVDTSPAPERKPPGWRMSLALALLEPYLALLAVDQHLPHWARGAIGDTLFLTSFFVLGGEFWEKVKALFIYEARAVLPAVSGPSAAGATTLES